MHHAGGTIRPSAGMCHVRLLPSRHPRADHYFRKIEMDGGKVDPRVHRRSSTICIAAHRAPPLLGRKVIITCGRSIPHQPNYHAVSIITSRPAYSLPSGSWKWTRAAGRYLSRRRVQLGRYCHGTTGPFATFRKIEMSTCGRSSAFVQKRRFN